MKKITGLTNELKMIGGEPYLKNDQTPLKVGDVILDYINAHAFPRQPTVQDMKKMGKIMELGERMYQCADEITLEDEEFNMLKEIMNPPVQLKVAVVMVQVMKVFDEAEDVKILPKIE